MPGGIIPIDAPGIGKTIIEFRRRRGLSQQDFAALAGVSQPTISKIEQGLRGDIRLSTWERICDTVPELRAGLVEDLDEIENRYDQALTLLARGDELVAEALFASIYMEPHSVSPITEELALRSRMRVAGIRRDRNELRGPGGAITLYQQADDDLPPEPRRPMIRMELRFCQGACEEMQRKDSEAAAVYRRAIASMSPQDPELMWARLHTRLGAVLTKMGKFGEASQHLRKSTAMSAHFQDPDHYSFAVEKRGILRMRMGDLERAHADIETARGEIPVGAPLRNVQSFIAEASILITATDYALGRERLAQAAAIAMEHKYDHQMKNIERIGRAIEGE